MRGAKAWRGVVRRGVAGRRGGGASRGVAWRSAAGAAQRGVARRDVACTFLLLRRFYTLYFILYKAHLPPVPLDFHNAQDEHESTEHVGTGGEEESKMHALEQLNQRLGIAVE